MNWMPKFAKASFVLYAGNTLEAFQPLDFFHYYPLWYKKWLERVATAIEVLDLKNKHYREVKHLLPVPSSMKAVIQKTIPAYKVHTPQEGQAHKQVADFLAAKLMEAMPEDPFGESRAPLHTKQEVEMLLKSVNWQTADVAAAKRLGRLIAAAGSLVHGLYNDLATDFGWDAYGPYPLENGQALLARHFPDLRPEALWDKIHLSSVKELHLYGIYENVEWVIAYIGCHTTLKSGSPIEGLKKYAVVADGRALTGPEIDALILELTAKAENIYREIRTLDFEELKEMVMLQECYQAKKLMDAAYMNWRPTKEMLQSVKGKPLAGQILPRGKLLTALEEYKEEFGLNKFERELLAEKQVPTL